MKQFVDNDENYKELRKQNQMEMDRLDQNEEKRLKENKEINDLQTDFKPAPIVDQAEINQIPTSDLKAPTSLPPVKKFKFADDELRE